MNAESKIVPAAPAVYAAIATIQGELAKVGIAKDKENSYGDKFKYRGIDDVYAALSPLLAKHGLCVIPRITSREQVERASRKGGALFYTTVHAEFDFVAVADGSMHTAQTYGEAMDSGDKSTNKAMAAAYKYAAFLTFGIPVEGESDADAETHEVQGNAKAVDRPARRANNDDRSDGGRRADTVKLIDDDQRDIIAGLAPAAGLTITSICASYKIKDLRDLPASKFNKLRDRIDDLIREKEAA